MITRGEYRDSSNVYGVIMDHSKDETEIILVQSGTVCSAYKRNPECEYSAYSSKAKEFYKLVQVGLSGCTSKNGESIAFKYGSCVSHSFIKQKTEFCVKLFNKCVVGCEIQTVDNRYINMQFDEVSKIPPGIVYIQLTNTTKNNESNQDDDVIVRSVQEIALEKEDITWLKRKKYYVVNNDETAEKLFSYFDNYYGPIAYDTETTGLKINCFGKINSSYKKQLKKYNEEHPDEQLRADRLVGIIFCAENDTSYYFPAFNRKFRNLYQTDTPTRRMVINNIKSRYTVGEFGTKQSDMADYIRNTPSDEWGCDVILMERVRDILHKHHIVCHNGAFDWKVSWQYEIDMNLKDDTMIMHQIMYKFRSTTSNAGESSKLKYLAKVEFGIEQWELSDFFPDFQEDNGSAVRSGAKGKVKKKGSTKIDFSYMTLEGTRVYAPADGDVTYLLFNKYKSDMIHNHREQEYIYNVEIVVACCIGYMEFYGLRLDEDKIYAVRDQTKAEIACIESDIRQAINYASDREIAAYIELKDSMQRYKEADKSNDRNKRLKANEETLEKVKCLYETISENVDHEINLGSPAQVAELFYDVLQYPVQGDKRSVASKQIKPLVSAKDDDGNLKYPVVKMYADYKTKDTLMTKFFDNLPYYMYPGGYIFSHFGQISTATGRMSCNKPNAQQFPKAVTAIVCPRPGYVMLDADYSQIEYRVLTALAKNEGLAKLFADPDSDYHTLMASMMYSVPYASVTPKMRGDAKKFNFGIPYGMGFRSLAILLTGNAKQSSVEEAKKKYELYFKNQPMTRKFFDNVKEMAQVNKYTSTYWHRYRFYSFEDKDGNTDNARKAAALRQAGNAVIQGCLDGETRIQTKELGIVKIKDVVNNHLMVWDGDKWSNGDILYSGKKQKCIVHFSNGQEFICSPIHKFLNIETGRFIKCKNLRGAKTGNAHKIKISAGELRVDSYDLTSGYIEVESVEITDEYIDMYDVCNTDGGYYVADGIITHNTAADVFKISVARNFSYIRQNGLLGLLLIINMIHDEQLMEVDVQHLNMQRVLGDVGKNMQFHIDQFPPLYIGAGIGPAWAKAKGKMAEIHPLLLDQFTKESESIPLWRTDTSYVEPKDVLKYFADRVFDFRKQKVINYLNDSKNYGSDLHPAIGNLLNLQFSYGHDKDAEKLSDEEFTQLCLSEFIKNNGLTGVDPNYFKANATVAEEEEEDKEYSDDEDFDVDSSIEINDSTFTVIDESNEVYGSTIQDLIGQFKFFASPNQKICGIDSIYISGEKKDKLVDYLYNHVCDSEDVGAMQIVFLQVGNVLNHTGVYVKDLNDDTISSLV